MPADPARTHRVLAQESRRGVCPIARLEGVARELDRRAEQALVCADDPHTNTGYFLGKAHGYEDAEQHVHDTIREHATLAMGVRGP